MECFKCPLPKFTSWPLSGGLEAGLRQSTLMKESLLAVLNGDRDSWIPCRLVCSSASSKLMSCSTGGNASVEIHKLEDSWPSSEALF